MVLAETRDHANWELIGHVAKHGRGDETQVLMHAFEAVEQEEDHHLYHTAGMDPRTVDRLVRTAGRAATSGRGQAGRVRDRRITRGTGPRRDAEKQALTPPGRRSRNVRT